MPDKYAAISATVCAPLAFKTLCAWEGQAQKFHEKLYDALPELPESPVGDIHYYVIRAFSGSDCKFSEGTRLL